MENIFANITTTENIVTIADFAKKPVDIAVNSAIKVNCIDVPLLAVLKQVQVLEVRDPTKGIVIPYNHKADLSEISESTEDLMDSYDLSTDFTISVPNLQKSMANSIPSGLAGYAIRFASHAYKDEYTNLVGEDIAKIVPSNYCGGLLGGAVRYGLRNEMKPEFIALGSINNLINEMCNSYTPCSNSKLASTSLTFLVETTDFVLQQFFKGNIKNSEDSYKAISTGAIVSGSILFCVNVFYLPMLEAKDLAYEYIIGPIHDSIHNYFIGSNETDHSEL